MIEPNDLRDDVERWCLRHGGSAGRTTIGTRFVLLFDKDGLLVGQGTGKTWNTCSIRALGEARRAGFP